MHTTVFYAAAVWMTVLLAVAVVLCLRARTALSRVLALDMLTLILVALLVLLAETKRVPYFLDAALALALFSFAATIAATRYLAERRLFS